MNDGNNDEFSAAKKTKEGGKKHKEEVCLQSEHTCIFVSEWVRESDRGRRWDTGGKGENKKNEENERAQGQNRVTT